MENINRNAVEEHKRLHNADVGMDKCDGCGHIFKPSRQEALEIVMMEFAEYLSVKGMKKLAKICASLGYTPAELGIEVINYTFGEEEDDAPADGTPHRYEIFLRSGASRFVTADEVTFDEDVEEMTGDVIKTIVFSRDGRIVAQMDRDTEFIMVEDTEKDDDKEE